MRLRPEGSRRPAWMKAPKLYAPKLSWPGRLPTWAEVQRLPVSMMIACLLAGLGAVQLTFLIGNGLYRSYVWQAQTRTVKGEIAALNTDLRVLREAQAHADDPQELQAQARCLGFVGKGETVIVAQDAPDGASNNCDAVRMP
ncbi:cell division protein FtsB [Deinococcus altitudinis]|uniref:cell division protein FtsB n=1 Tax=Deinococcus altitudinis TaxID=468914 RepID=UPI003891B80A